MFTAIDLPDVEAEPAVEGDRTGVGHRGDRLQLLRSLRGRDGSERVVKGPAAPGSARLVADGDRVNVTDAARRGEPDQVAGDPVTGAAGGQAGVAELRRQHALVHEAHVPAAPQ